MPSSETPYVHRSINVLFFERHDPLDVVAVEMKATGTRKKPRRFTRIREMRDSIKEHGYWAGRGDIVMVNVESGPKFDQHVAYPTWSGEPRGPALDWLTEDEIERVRDQNRKILAAVEEYPEMAFLLSGRREDGQSTREWVAERVAERKLANARRQKPALA